MGYSILHVRAQHGVGFGFGLFGNRYTGYQKWGIATTSKVALRHFAVFH